MCRGAALTPTLSRKRERGHSTTAFGLYGAMPSFTDDAILLSTRRHGESSAIVSLLTRDHGRAAGLVRGGAGRAGRGVLQPGNRVVATWTARLEEHLGYLTCDLITAHAAWVLDDPGRLAALSAACAVTDATTPDREPLPGLFAAWEALLAALPGSDWAGIYVRWELALLAELGYGLDLSRCAATGTTTDLVYVSPKSACAVSAPAGAPYRDKLLPLPGFLLMGAPATPAELRDGLRLTGYFLQRHALDGAALPAARGRLVERVVGWPA